MEISSKCLQSTPCDHVEFYIDAEYAQSSSNHIMLGDVSFKFTTKEFQEHQKVEEHLNPRLFNPKLQPRTFQPNVIEYRSVPYGVLYVKI